MNRVEKLCLAGLVALPLGVGATAFAILRTPAAIACEEIDQSAAVSVRLHCAYVRADRQTPESLAAAIELVGKVTADEPLQTECDQAINGWSAELRRKAEAEFQAGNLEKAISILRSSSDNAKIQAWRNLWSNGESILKTAQTQIDKRQWQQAFETANRLRQLENEYWAKEQYITLIRQIQSDRELRDFTAINPIAPARKDPEFSLPEEVSITPLKSRVPWQNAPSNPHSAQTPPKSEPPAVKIQPSTIETKNDAEPEPPILTLPENSKQEGTQRNPQPDADRT